MKFECLALANRLYELEHPQWDGSIQQLERFPPLPFISINCLFKMRTARLATFLLALLAYSSMQSHAEDLSPGKYDSFDLQGLS